MGLDLYHVKPVSSPIESHHYFTKEELSEYPDFLEKHKELIQRIDELSSDTQIVVFENEKIRNAVKNDKRQYLKDKVWLTGNIDELDIEINKIEIEKNLVNRNKLIVKCIDNWLTNKMGFEISYHTIGYEFPTVSYGIYYEEVGYQRKGMNENFYIDFIDDKLYMDFKDVKKAREYIDHDRKDYKVLLNNFDENFINKFEEGVSIFFPSW